MANRGGNRDGGNEGERADERRGSRISRASLNLDYDQLDEYGKIQKFVSEIPKETVDKEQDGVIEEKRIWYAPWKTRKVRIRNVDDSTTEYPDEWLNTDIREGLSPHVITDRRKRTGLNELVSEKENPVAKVLSYFQGPILYGKCHLSCQPME